MIVPAIAAAAVFIGYVLVVWYVGLKLRWRFEAIRYRARLQARQPYPTKADYLEALQAAMVITCRAYGARLETLIAERLATDPFVRDADRAHGMLESALRVEQRVEHVGLRVV